MLEQISNACKDDPSIIFNLIKEGNYELAYNLVNKNIVNINTVDGIGNDVVTRLLRAKQYDYVLELMKKKNWDVNHQNYEGNTFGHILAQDNSIMAGKVAEQLTKKSNYLPNIKNKNGKSAMDIALSNNYLCTAFKILEDKRFNEIDIFSFKNLFNVSIQNKDYGKYSRITNLEIIVENLDKKDLSSNIKKIIEVIKSNMETIKWEIMNNKYNILDTIINSYL